jgi:glycogen phosphorylase
MLRQSKVPQRIGRLDELANNLWWSWHKQARDLFPALDHRLWHSTGHNPVRLLQDIGREKLIEAASDPTFLNHYDSAMSAFDADMSSKETWFSTRCPDLTSARIAYFSPEFAFHSSLPIYAGGLGILAGDTCKEASDCGLPLVGVGFMYPQGYFHQHISNEGWQQETYRQLNFDEAPINSCALSQECRGLIEVPMGDKAIYLHIWQVRIGRINVNLLDTNVEDNSPQDRQLSARLYTADQDQRIQQEIVLGVGGVRALRALGIEPVIWHANEGHSAFMMLERVREEVGKGIPFAEASKRIAANTVFTTHTPVAAGTDIFPVQLVDKYFYNYWKLLGIERETFLGLGQKSDTGDQTFNMTVLGLKMADHRTGVSQLHGKVARKMWNNLWPGVKEEAVPIIHITNGVHVPSWVAPEAVDLYQKFLGPIWVKRHYDTEIMTYLKDIPDNELWEMRKILRRQLIHSIQERAQERWAIGTGMAPQVLGMGALLDAGVLTICFARRFAEYKRPTLIFQDIERLKKIVTNRDRPVQIIFAGKSHPADYPSKDLLHQVYSMATDPGFQGRIAFAEDYDMDLAHYLVQGADIWLNNPCSLMEACGTSGMKASLNGTLNLSIRDGWWYEGYNGLNGWAISIESGKLAGEQNKDDAESIYRLLENKIVPLFYDRDTNDVPRGWISVVKEAICSIMPAFCTRRMVKDYIDKMYRPAFQSTQSMKAMATNLDPADLIEEHQAIGEHIKFLTNSLNGIDKPLSQEKSQSTQPKDQIRLYRWSLYDFREAIKRHIDLDERIFRMLDGSTSIETIIEEHKTIQKQLEGAISLAENAVYNKLSQEEQNKCASEIKESVDKICQSIGAHMVEENKQLKQVQNKS